MWHWLFQAVRQEGLQALTGGAHQHFTGIALLFNLALVQKHQLVTDLARNAHFEADENTALLANQIDKAGTTNFSVTGATGVFVVDIPTAHTAPAGSPAWWVRGAVAHSHLQIGFAPCDGPCPTPNLQ